MSRGSHVVTGPDLEVAADSASLGLSRAITAGSGAAHRREEATYYVRDRDDEVVGRVEGHADGTVTILGEAHFR